MKSIPICLFLCSAAFPLQAQVAEPAITEIPGPIADGQPGEPAIEREPIEFKIKSGMTKRMFVEESPELVGLPPVTGTINVTVELVEDPGLADPPPPLALLDFDDPAVQARIAEARARYKETQILFVSARVLDYDKTVLEVYPNGQAKESVTVLSSIDYNDFSGFATFNVAGLGEDGKGEEVRQYALIMGIGNEITENMERFAARSGRTYTPPELPQLPEGDTPSFIVLEGDNEGALQTIRDMHTLYAAEGARMHTSRIAREKAYEERKAYLLANPQKPNDVKIQFWKRAEAAAGVEIQQEGTAQ